MNWKSLSCINQRLILIIFISLSFSVNISFAQTKSELNKSLIESVKNGNIDKVKELISKGADVNAREKSEGFSALHYAARYGHVDIARELLDGGADINISNKYGVTPIKLTVFDIITWNKTIMYDQKKGMGSKSLWHKEVFDLLIERNAKVRPKELLLEAVGSNDPRLLEYIETKWNVSIPKDDVRYVYNAAVRGAHESLKWLISKGAELSKLEEGYNFTPLGVARKNRDMKSIELLQKAIESKRLSISENSEISLKASYGLDTDGGAMVMRNGQWVPDSSTNVTGEFVLIVEIDKETKRFPTSVNGTKMVKDKVTYLCENGESFYIVNGKIPYPIVTKKIKKGSEYLEKLIDEYRKNKTEKLAWDIWKLKSLEK